MRNYLAIATLGIFLLCEPASAPAGPCSLTSPKTSDLRLKALNLARVEAAVMQPLNSVIRPANAGSAVDSSRASARALRFDKPTQQAIKDLATSRFDLAKLTEHDRLRLTVDPLRTHPAQLKTPVVVAKPWPTDVERSTLAKPTPFHVVGDNGTVPLPHVPDRAGAASAPLCNAAPGRPRDPACVFDLPPFRVFPIGDPPTNLNQRRTAIANLSTVIIVIDSTDGRRQICTGAHLGQGVLLTAHHCHRMLSFEAAQYRVHFNTEELATPFAGGLEAKPLNADDNDAVDLDFLLLKVPAVPERFASAFLKLSPRDPWTSCSDGADLETYITWHEDNDRVSKRFSADSQCVTVRNATCFGERGRRVHRCDTSERSSGAPILLRGGNAVVAVHTNGRLEQDSNCALPTAEIRKALFTSTGAPKLPDISAIVWED